VDRQGDCDVLVSNREPVDAHPMKVPAAGSFRAIAASINLWPEAIMKAASFDRMPNDVLIVEDDPIIALDFEDTILGFGVKTVRTARSVAKALQMISDRAPDFALLDVGLVREKSFAIAERLDLLKIPFVFVTGYSAVRTFPAAFADRPRLPKPYSTDALQALLKGPPDNRG
jgi:CheY-like chemotaxis protein